MWVCIAIICNTSIIKAENRETPAGSRQSIHGYTMTCYTLHLRTSEGILPPHFSQHSYGQLHSWSGGRGKDVGSLVGCTPEKIPRCCRFTSVCSAVMAFCIPPTVPATDENGSSGARLSEQIAFTTTPPHQPPSSMCSH